MQGMASAAEVIERLAREAERRRIVEQLEKCKTLDELREIVAQMRGQG